MSNLIQQVFDRARAWAIAAQSGDWLDQLDVECLAEVSRARPGDLFVDTQERPLVVALFGGTGVGKSSLLNRLAGAAIARTGVERPTSREVSFYVHEAVRLADLPPALPTEGVRISRHASERFRAVAWIDAPDIDSTVESNRQLALAWLPHADLVLYVVSPERYRDDIGWRVLQARRERHGWMFVMNRWDEGDPGQSGQFVAALREAGFENPALFHTCCATSAEAQERIGGRADEFDGIVRGIKDLLDAHGLSELERLGRRAQLHELGRALRAPLQKLGAAAGWSEISHAWHARWDGLRRTLLDGAEWVMRGAASRIARRSAPLANPLSWGRAVLTKEAPGDRTGEPIAPDDAATLTAPLWDEWSMARLASAIDALEVDLRRLGITADVARRELGKTAAAAPRIVETCVGEALRLALGRPGGALRRVARGVAGFLSIALPATALLWIAYHVVVGFHRASGGGGMYLGTDFAVHSALLVLVAWAVPFALDRLLRPSVERTALAALRTGLSASLNELERRFRDDLAGVAAEAARIREEGEAIVAECSALEPAARGLPTETVDVDSPVQRVIARSS